MSFHTLSTDVTRGYFSLHIGSEITRARETFVCACAKNFFTLPNLVPRASFPLTSGQKTRALGATISGMRHRCRCAVSRITRIRLFPLFFHNGCSQSSRFPTAGQGERSFGNEIVLYPFAGGAGSPSHDTARQSSGEVSQM